MKRILAIVLAIIMVVSLCACGKDKKAEKHCPNCDETIRTTATFCDYCGANVKGTDDDSTDDTTSSTNTSTTSNSNTSSANTSKPTTTSKPTSSTSTTGEFTVTFNLGYEGKTFTAKSQNYKVAKPKEPTRNGYKFLYWHATDNTEQWNFSGHAVTTDMTLNAKWNKYCYYIHYSNVIDGKKSDIFKEGIGTPDKVWDSSNGTPPKLEKGIVGLFNGYSVAVDDGTEFITRKFVGGLYYSPDCYDHHFFDVPGCFSIDSESFTVPKLSFEGYEFLGWTYDGQSTPVKTVTIPKGTTKDYNLVANWKSK